MTARDDRALFASAAACAALVFVVVAASAWLRLAATPCPAGGCAGFGLADAVRLSHRVAAMGVTVAALVIAALAWKSPARWGRRASALAVLALVATLAVVGRRSAGSAPPAVVLANLLGGLALLAFAVGLAVAAKVPGGRPRAPIAVAAGLYALATLTGAALAAAPGTPMLDTAHRALAAVSLIAWAMAAARAGGRAGARAAAALAAGCLAAQAALALVVPGNPVAHWLHNVLASAALCAVVAASLAAPAAPPASGRIAGGAGAGP